MTLDTSTTEPTEPTMGDLAAGLRDAAAFLETHPHLPVRVADQRVTFLMPWTATMTDVIAAAAELAPCDIAPHPHLTNDVVLSRQFGAVTVEVVCRKTAAGEVRSVTRSVDEYAVDTEVLAAAGAGQVPEPAPPPEARGKIGEVVR